MSDGFLLVCLPVLALASSTAIIRKTDELFGGTGGFVDSLATGFDWLSFGGTGGRESRAGVLCLQSSVFASAVA